MVKKKTKDFLNKRVDVNIPLPDNKFGKWLKKDGHIFPKYFRDSYRELKKVVWPNRKETWRLFFAVVLFALVLTSIIMLADYFFNSLIERVIL